MPTDNLPKPTTPQHPVDRVVDALRALLSYIGPQASGAYFEVQADDEFVRMVEQGQAALEAYALFRQRTYQHIDAELVISTLQNNVTALRIVERDLANAGFSDETVAIALEALEADRARHEGRPVA